MKVKLESCCAWFVWPVLVIQISPSVHEYSIWVDWLKWSIGFVWGKGWDDNIVLRVIE